MVLRGMCACALQHPVFTAYQLLCPGCFNDPSTRALGTQVDYSLFILRRSQRKTANIRLFASPYLSISALVTTRELFDGLL
jgi:hypothetical protein